VHSFVADIWHAPISHCRTAVLLVLHFSQTFYYCMCCDDSLTWSSQDRWMERTDLVQSQSATHRSLPDAVRPPTSVLNGRSLHNLLVELQPRLWATPLPVPISSSWAVSSTSLARNSVFSVRNGVCKPSTYNILPGRSSEAIHSTRFSQLPSDNWSNV
jgi:hypothetical protein